MIGTTGMRKAVVGLATVLVAGFGPSGVDSARADCGEVTITEMNWASSAVVTAVAEFLMTEGYGCEVSKVPSSTTPSVTSVAETGKPDIVTELWVNSAAAYFKLRDEGKVFPLAEVLSDGGVEGWFLPSYLVEQDPELRKIDYVLANPDKVGEMFHTCPDGWGCAIANANLTRAYALEEHGFKVFKHGSGETLATSLASAYTEGKSWFGYYWGPTAILGKYSMVKIDVGPYVEDVHTCNMKMECASPGRSDFPRAPVYTVVTDDFRKREPEIVDLMSKLSFSNEVMGKLLAWQEDNKASAGETAVFYLENYKSVWVDWLSDGARQKLAKFL